ncbi:TPA: hypothetical protein J0A02_005084, partial [Escherichia coli]|nr:hypothetical protein [Escherichia coli]
PHHNAPVQSRINKFFNDLIADESTISSRHPNQYSQTPNNRPVASLSPVKTNPKQPPRHPQPPYRP